MAKAASRVQCGAKSLLYSSFKSSSVSLELSSHGQRLSDVDTTWWSRIF